jgi:hypothetical protein
MPRQPRARHRAEHSRPQAPGRYLVTARHGPPGADGSGRHASAVYRLRADDLATAVKRDGQGSNHVEAAPAYRLRDPLLLG